MTATSPAGVPFGISTEEFLAERGVPLEPLVVPVVLPRRGAGRQGSRSSRRRELGDAAGGTAALDAGAVALDSSGADAAGREHQGADEPLPGRFQGPAAALSVGGPRREKGERTFPTREERDARRQEREAERAEQVAADPVGVARQVCLDQLSFAPRTRQELARVLAARGVPEKAAQEVLGRFAEVGMIDDVLFATEWVSSRHRTKGLAGRALSQELRRKGVDDETVRAAVDELDPEQEAETARELVRKRLAASRGLPTQARVRRLTGMLARKGYGAGTAFRVVREELAQEGTDPPDLSFDQLQSLEE